MESIKNILNYGDVLIIKALKDTKNTKNYITIELKKIIIGDDTWVADHSLIKGVKLNIDFTRRKSREEAEGRFFIDFYKTNIVPEGIETSDNTTQDHL